MDKIFRALADKNRRLILTLLKESQLTVGEIVKKLPVGQATVSTHLSILLKAKLVNFEAKGKNRIYSMNMEVWNELIKHLQKFTTSTDTRIPDEIILRRK
ncbi:MAG: metalloregulator ArsR/SmtB family transcription factor [Candidatus Shapirobacteria bacterium]